MRVIVPSDSGNGEVLSTEPVLVGPAVARIRVRSDNAAAFRQWFWVRAEDLDGAPLALTILDAGGCSYPGGWPAYRAVARLGAEGDDWVRVPTSYADGQLTIALPPGHDRIDVAYFAPYPHARRVERVRDWAARGADVRDLGPTPDGLALPIVTVGRGPSPVWIVARQHPGETMAEWFVEGLVERLLGAGGGAPAGLLDRVTFRIAPCVNPDGARRGNHRTNALGLDLNRQWADPDPERAPEVRRIRDAMDDTGVAFALDVHGDEEIPYNFAGGGEGTPAWDPRRAAVKRRFIDAWLAATPDMQAVHGYPTPAPGEGNLTVCSQQLCERFRCVALTVEQPFLDHDDNPEPVAQWSPARAKALGASVLEPLVAVVADLA